MSASWRDTRDWIRPFSDIGRAKITKVARSTGFLDADLMSSLHNPAEAMQTRIREDLRTAMRAKSHEEVAALRVCLAAIDNAQAVPVGARHQTYEVKAFGDRSVEVPRLVLDETSLRAVLAREIEDRLSAADQLEQHGNPDRGAALRAGAVIIGRYL